MAVRQNLRTGYGQRPARTTAGGLAQGGGPQFGVGELGGRERMSQIFAEFEDFLPFGCITFIIKQRHLGYIKNPRVAAGVVCGTI
jgi:hypothetical protein